MASKSILQREIKKHVVAQLQTSLSDLKDILGEKKFGNRIKKAAKLLTEGVAKTKKENAEAGTQPEEQTAMPVPETAAPKKTVKKAIAKKTISAPAKTAKKAVVSKKAAATKK